MTLQRDLSNMPNDLTFEKIDRYIQEKAHSSGEEHKSKGYLFFHENYIHDRHSKLTVSLLTLDNL